MNQCHLAGVDAQQAAKTHVTGIGSHTGHAFGVFDVGENAVQRRRQVRQCAVQDNGVARLIEHALGASSATHQAKVEAQIQRPKTQARHPVGTGNGRQLKQAFGALDDRPHRLGASRHPLHLLSAFGLGQQHGDHAGVAST